MKIVTVSTFEIKKVGPPAIIVSDPPPVLLVPLATPQRRVTLLQLVAGTDPRLIPGNCFEPFNIVKLFFRFFSGSPLATGNLIFKSTQMMPQKYSKVQKDLTGPILHLCAGNLPKEAFV